MNDIFFNIAEWIKNDWRSNRIRFAIELFAWVCSIGCSITMSATVPNPPLLFLYPVWISSCIMYGWASWSRRSFGMLANYLLLVSIDLIGLLRMLNT